MVDTGDVGGCPVTYGELVVPGGQGPVVLEVAEASFHGVAVLVGDGVEGRCRPPRGPLGLAVGGLVGLDRDRGADVVGPQLSPVGP